MLGQVSKALGKGNNCFVPPMTTLNLVIYSQRTMCGPCKAKVDLNTQTMDGMLDGAEASHAHTTSWSAKDQSFPQSFYPGTVTNPGDIVRDFP